MFTRNSVFVLCGGMLLAACSDDTANTSADAPAAAAPTALSQAVATASDDIRGRVTSGNGAEAGVWVIAETRDLPTRFARTVVTNDNGEYLIPDLPAGSYD